MGRWLPWSSLALAVAATGEALTSGSAERGANVMAALRLAALRRQAAEQSLEEKQRSFYALRHRVASYLQSNATAVGLLGELQLPSDEAALLNSSAVMLQIASDGEQCMPVLPKPQNGQMPQLQQGRGPNLQLLSKLLSNPNEPGSANAAAAEIARQGVGRPLAPQGPGVRPLVPMKPCPPPPWLIKLIAMLAPGGGIITMLLRMIKRIIMQIKFKLGRIIKALARIFANGPIVPVLDNKPLPWDVPTKVPYPPIKPDIGPRVRPPRWWFVPPRWYSEAPHWILAPPWPADGETKENKGEYGAYGQGSFGGHPVKAVGDKGFAKQYFPDKYPEPNALLEIASDLQTRESSMPGDSLDSAKALLVESEGLESRAVAGKLRLESLHHRLLMLTSNVTAMVERHSSSSYV